MAWFGLIRRTGLGALLRPLVLTLLGGLVVGVAALLVARVRRRSRRAPGARVAAAAGVDPVPPELRELLRRLDRYWTKAGHPRPPSRAPLEHWRTIPEAARPGRELVDAVYQCRYGGRAPTPEELAGLRRSLPD